MQAMVEEDRKELLTRAFEHQLALVSSSKISSEDFSETQREARDIFKDIEGVLRPWLGMTRDDRKTREEMDFKQQWEEFAGFSPDDKEAVDKWSQEIKKHTDAAQDKRVDVERAEAERQSSFHAKIEAVRLKRLKQQGRR